MRGVASLGRVTPCTGRASFRTEEHGTIAKRKRRCNQFAWRWNENRNLIRAWFSVTNSELRQRGAPQTPRTHGTARYVHEMYTLMVSCGSSMIGSKHMTLWRWEDCSLSSPRALVARSLTVLGTPWVQSAAPERFCSGRLQGRILDTACQRTQVRTSGPRREL